MPGRGDLKIMVFCCSNAGVSRSASFVIAYMIREKGMSFDEAIAHVKKIRPCVFPNIGFTKQLQEYASTIRNRLTKASTGGEKTGAPSTRPDIPTDQ
jgi:protein-tyrosine phosphatase